MVKIEKVKDKSIIEGEIDEIFGKEKENWGAGYDYNYEAFAYAVKGDNGEILGGIHGRRIFRSIMIDEFAIDESLRGQGIGRKLLDMVEREIHNDKCDNIVLHTNGFSKVVDFYKKCGFEIEFVRKNNDPRYDKYYMIKKL